MSKTKGKLYLPDTSAIMAFLENERGADHVEKILTKEKIVLPFIVFLEIFISL